MIPMIASVSYVFRQCGLTCFASFTVRTLDGLANILDAVCVYVCVWGGGVRGERERESGCELVVWKREREGERERGRQADTDRECRSVCM